MNKSKSVTFPTLPSHAPCKNTEITFGFGFYFPNQIVIDFQILKSGQRPYEILVSFFYVKGLCWPLYDHRISCNAIGGVVWTVNNDHDTTDTPKTT